MSALDVHTNTPAKAVRKTRSAKSKPEKRRETSAEIEPQQMEQDLSSSQRKKVLSLAGKELASSLGSILLQKMLAEYGKSMREVARETGFDVSLLSNIASGKRKSGPELWTLVALAEAMDLDIRLDFSRR